MRETEEFQPIVVDLAHLYGWRAMHVRRSIGKGRKWTTATSIKGWPDLFLYHPGKRWHYAVELKNETGQLSPEQEIVLEELDNSGVETGLWRPQNLDDGSIQRMLAHGYDNGVMSWSRPLGNG
jgi:hypothetical protein